MSHEISVSKVIEKLPSRFIRENAANFKAIFQFELEDDQDFYIAIEDQSCTVTTGEHPDPDITLIMAAQTFINVINGEQDGMGAFMSGKLRAEGSIILATRLSKLFSRKKQS
ncbi:MAG: SCP-2 family sterol carrier protein [Neptuniibacter caesariensis]|uniref:SCP-2 family sterol carrier protein n=1 Tax=Neptuniibacter caesariensis TaxID=207954 RepID=A0A2G6JPK7_NEPCE|nr:MAG: SCP-2 family sterol carrier protein [Neptuniibacter caesariensis]